MQERTPDARMSAIASSPPMTPRFEAAFTSRKAELESLSQPMLVERLASVEEELSLHKLQTAKRLYAFLNQRLCQWIQEWKAVEDHEGGGDAAASLASLISEARASAEEALQMTLALRPAKLAGTPAMTLPLSVKARWQGAPSSTLKPVTVSQDWRALLAQPEPLLQMGAGPAQQWRLSLNVAHPPAVRSSSDGGDSGGGPAQRWRRGAAATTVKPASDEAALTVPVGFSAELTIEAVDGEGRVDDELCSVVLLESRPLGGGGDGGGGGGGGGVGGGSSQAEGGREGWPTVEGLGFVPIVGGVGKARLCSVRSGACELLLQDGANSQPHPLSILAPPPPLALRFVSGAPVGVSLVPSAPTAITGSAIRVRVVVVDAFGNAVAAPF